MKEEPSPEPTLVLDEELSARAYDVVLEGREKIEEFDRGTEKLRAEAKEQAVDFDEEARAAERPILPSWHDAVTAAHAAREKERAAAPDQKSEIKNQK